MSTWFDARFIRSGSYMLCKRSSARKPMCAATKPFDSGVLGRSKLEVRSNSNVSHCQAAKTRRRRFTHWRLASVHIPALFELFKTDGNWLSGSPHVKSIKLSIFLSKHTWYFLVVAQQLACDTSLIVWGYSGRHKFVACNFCFLLIPCRTVFWFCSSVSNDSEITLSKLIFLSSSFSESWPIFEGRSKFHYRCPGVNK